MIERIERVPGWNKSNPEEYEMKVNGKPVDVVYSSYGISLGWTGNKNFVAYSCNEGNRFFFMEVKYHKEEIKALENSEESRYDWLWNLERR